MNLLPFCIHHDFNLLLVFRAGAFVYCEIGKINFDQQNYYAVESVKKGIVVFLISIIAQGINIPKRLTQSRIRIDMRILQT